MSDRACLSMSLDPPLAGRLLAVSDIHGCLPQLEELLRQVAPTADDRLVFLGDYIDRGPDSAGVVDRLIALREQFPATVFLRGNHEQMFLDYLAGVNLLRFLANGGAATLTSYHRAGGWPLPEAHLKFFESLPLHHQTARHIFVHAGLRPGLPLEQQEATDLLWIRGDFLDSVADFGKTVVYGHTPRKEPLLGEHRIGLDTGCVYGGQLTCCDVLSRAIWQSPV